MRSPEDLTFHDIADMVEQLEKIEKQAEVTPDEAAAIVKELTTSDNPLVASLAHLAMAFTNVNEVVRRSDATVASTFTMISFGILDNARSTIIDIAVGRGLKLGEDA